MVTPYREIVRLVGPAMDDGRLPASELAELPQSSGRTVPTVDAARIGPPPYRHARWRW